jgi:hypothetical protein
VLINHVDRYASEAAAGVGLGDGAGVGDGTGLGDGPGIGMGVGVGVGCILLETEPQPAMKKKISALIKTKMAVRKAPPILAIREFKIGNL